MAVRKSNPTKSRAEQALVITRLFNAPRELLWKALTEPQRMARWWGPNGFTVRASKMDLRPGGVYHYCLRSPVGRDRWGKFVYREIVQPARLVFVNSFSDEAGHLTRHPLSPSWPLEMLSTMTCAEQEGRATLTVQRTPLKATEEERRISEAGRDSMRQGWTGTLDQLAAYLASA